MRPEALSISLAIGPIELAVQQAGIPPPRSDTLDLHSVARKLLLISRQWSLNLTIFVTLIRTISLGYLQTCDVPGPAFSSLFWSVILRSCKFDAPVPLWVVG